MRETRDIRKSVQEKRLVLYYCSACGVYRTSKSNGWGNYYTLYGTPYVKGWTRQRPECSGTTQEVGMPIKGEGTIELVRRTRVRIACAECGEPATNRHTWLLKNARNNPASSAYRHDDCSWCSDAESFTCDAHDRYKGAPDTDVYTHCSTFMLDPEREDGGRFAHMFLQWREEKLTEADELVKLTVRKGQLERALDFAYQRVYQGFKQRNFDYGVLLTRATAWVEGKPLDGTETGG